MKYAVMFLTMISLSAWAHADTSVWSQMQNGSASRFSATITERPELASDGLQITYVKQDGLDNTETARFCDDFSTEDYADNYFDAELRRSGVTAERLRILRDAYKSGETVELSSRGPWSPCIQSVRPLKTTAAQREKAQRS